MKKYLIIHLLTFSAIFNLSAQSFDFAPIGAKWYYEESNFAPPLIYPHIVESVSKETYHGKWCSKLTRSSAGPLSNPTYVYTQNDTVYFYSNASNQFHMLYDFTAGVGDSWVIEGLTAYIPNSPLPYASDTITVDSISYMLVNSDSLKVWHIQNTLWFDWGDRIIERVGNDALFAPKFGFFEFQIWGLRCFETPDTAFHFVPYPCDTSYSTFSKTLDLSESDGLKVAPNPFQEQITITSETPSVVFSFSLYDQTGRIVFLQPNAVGSLVVNTEPLPPGLYFWNVVIGGVMVKSGKCVKT